MPILDEEVSVHPDDLLTDFCLREDQADRKWWVLRTKPRQEKAVARQLYAQDIPFYLPLTPKQNIVRGKLVFSHVPVFTSYAFLFGTDDERVSALKTNRLTNILAVEQQDSLCRDLCRVRDLLGTGVPLTSESLLKPGDAVRIRKGSLAGQEGTVLRRKGKCYLVVAVQMIGRALLAEIDDFTAERL